MKLAESIERLEAMPAFVARAVAGAAPDALVYRPGPEELSLVEQACHLRDLEREGYLVRVRRMLTEPAPALEPFDGAAVARERRYLEQDAKLAAQDFSAARRELTGLLAPLTESDLERRGTFDGEPLTFRDLIAMMLEHDRGHRDEIERLLARRED
jgi:hypothetical protein